MAPSFPLRFSSTDQADETTSRFELEQGFEDLENDVQVGFQLLTTDDIDEMKPSGIIEAIKRRVGNTPTYLSFDIDTIDPSMAPASKLSPCLSPPSLFLSRYLTTDRKTCCEISWYT